jgi:hypothetical protein
VGREENGHQGLALDAGHRGRHQRQSRDLVSAALCWTRSTAIRCSPRPPTTPGPGRARAWRSGTAIEGRHLRRNHTVQRDRDYVKKVMANATYYAHTFGQQLQTPESSVLSVIRAALARQGGPPLGDTP